jgi:hypothetical protein
VITSLGSETGYTMIGRIIGEETTLYASRENFAYRGSTGIADAVTVGRNS